MTPLPYSSVLACRENVGRARWQLRRQRARPRLRLTLQRGKPRHMILVRFTQTPPGGGFGRRLRRRWCVGKGAASDVFFQAFFHASSDAMACAAVLTPKGGHEV